MSLTDGRVFSEKAPAAVSEARFGQSGLYVPKMLRYCEQMGYSEAYVQKLRQFCKFQVVLVPYRQSVGFSLDVQVNDLHFRRQLEKFRAIDEFEGGLVDAVKDTFKRHLQFLSPEFSFLSLISYNVTPAEKKIIAKAIATTSNESLSPAPLKPAVSIDEHTQLKDLASGPRTRLVFQLLNIDPLFLTKELQEWETDEQFQRLCRFALNFQVTNTVAEHCVQLVTDYSEIITKDEQQRQYLYKTVTKQRRERSDLRRATLQPTPVKSSPPQDRSHLKR